MTRRISLIFLISLFAVVLLANVALAAKADRNPIANRPADVVQEVPTLKVYGAEDVPYDPALASKPINFSSSARLGFSPAGTFQIGSTYQDYQKNGSMGRQIVFGGGWVHNVWMVLPGPSTSNRVVAYYAWRPSTPGTFAEVLDISNTTGDGYITVDFDPTGTGAATPAWHRVAGGGTFGARDFALAAASFTPFLFPPQPNCQSIVSGIGPNEGAYIWPVVASDVIGSDNVIHVVAIESPPNTNDQEQSIVYYRSNAGISAPGPTCAYWIDSAWNVTPVIAADPNSDKVAIVYLRPADYAFSGGFQQRNQDVVYVESQNGGTTWGAIQSITNYHGGILERAYTDVTALYTSDGCLHVGWNTAFFDSAAGQVGTFSAKLRHWDDCNQCISLVHDANNFDPEASTGAWNLAASKMNLSQCFVGGDTLLYMSYTRFASTEANPDRSQGGYVNGDIWIQASSTGGETWGPPTNLTNTNSNNCAAGNCFSEHWSSSAKYVTDTLYIQYIVDKDAGGIVQDEGVYTNNPVMNMSVPCFTMATFVDLSATPNGFGYPYNTAPAQQKNEMIVLANSGNAPANWTASSAQSWISFPFGNSGICPAGCNNEDSLQVRFTGPATEGLYIGTIDVNFTSPNKGDQAILSIPVELYNFTNFCLPEDQKLRTASVRMVVNQASETSANTPGSDFTYFADLQADPSASGYLYDGFLVMGNSASNLTFSLRRNIGAGITLPTTSNPFGFLYAKDCETDIDSTTSAVFRWAEGRGYNRDSTIEFKSEFYGPKLPGDNVSEFFVGKFSLYAGPNFSGTVSNLTVGYYADWDVPSDSGSDNNSQTDPSRFALIQRGAYAPPNSERWGAIAAVRDDGSPIVGGFVVDNPTYIYPFSGWHTDSLWNQVQLLLPGEYKASTVTNDDLSTVVVMYRGASLGASDTLETCVVFAGKRSAANVAGIQAAIDKAFEFICDNDLCPGASICAACLCGDADGNGLLTIGDAVFIITHIFGGGPAPNPACLGDADNNGLVTIGDAVFLITHIFGGGPAPGPNC